MSEARKQSKFMRSILVRTADGSGRLAPSEDRIRAASDQPPATAGGSDSPACLCVIRQRSFVPQHATRPDQRRAADVTTTSDDRFAHLRRSAHARVTPNHRVLNARALFDVATFAENRVDNLDAGFEYAIVGDDR